MQEKTSPLHRGVRWLQDLFLTSKGLMIGDARLHGKRDPSGNFDPYWKRRDGSEVNLTGEVLFCRATDHLTLTTSAQSIVGDGDSTKVRLILPTIGEWTVEAAFHFYVTATDPGACIGELFVNDGGSSETGQAIFGVGAVDRDITPQRWKVTTTAVDIPVELKAKKQGAGGTASCRATHTTLAASIGAGGGSTVESVDHGTLTGRGDDDHTQYILAAGTRAFSGEQSMGTNKLTNVVDPAANQDAATKKYVDDNDHAQTHAAADHSAANIIPDANQAYTGDMGITGALTATSYGGITEANLVDKSAAETVPGIWTFGNGLKTDTISEETGAAGVTADGVKFKDGSVVIADGGYLGSVSDTDAIQIEADGDVVLTQDLKVTGVMGVNIAAAANTLLTLSLPASPTAAQWALQMSGNVTPQNDDVDMYMFEGRPTIYLNTADQVNSSFFGLSSDVILVNTSGAVRNYGEYTGMHTRLALSHSGGGYINLSSSTTGIRVAQPIYSGSVYALTLYGIHIQNQVLGDSGTGITTFYGMKIDETTEMRNAAGNAYAIHVTAPSGSAGTTNYGIVQAGTGDSTLTARNQFQASTAFGALIAPAATVDITQPGSTAAIPVLELDQDDTSEPFIDFVGTSTADANSSISSLNTSGATTDHIQIDLNGAKAWIAVSTNAPS